MEQQIARVVIGSRDPNPKVAGKGAAILRNAGIEVEEDFLKEECDRLNDVFFHYITTGTPYVAMKYAMTADGKIATHTGASKWITGEAAREEVQHMRHHYMGIMAGIGTVLADDPMLNVRLEGGRNPVRIICDSRLRIPLSSRICKSAGSIQTIVAYANEAQTQQESRRLREKRAQLEELGITALSVPDAEGRIDLARLMKILGGMEIDSVLLEGGGDAQRQRAAQPDRAGGRRLHRAEAVWRRERKDPPWRESEPQIPQEAVGLEMREIRQIGEDLLIRYQVKKVEYMFTGIIEESGTVQSLQISGNSGKICICAKKVLEGTKIGDSIAVNGIMPDGDVPWNRRLYGGYHGGDSAQEQSGKSKGRDEGESGAGDGGGRKIWRSYRVGTYRRDRNDPFVPQRRKCRVGFRGCRREAAGGDCGKRIDLHRRDQPDGGGGRGRGLFGVRDPAHRGRDDSSVKETGGSCQS